MTLDALIMLTGFFVAALPFLGFPIQWDNAILVTLGVLTIVLGIFVRRRGAPKKESAPHKTAAEETTPVATSPISEGESRYDETAGH